MSEDKKVLAKIFKGFAKNGICFEHEALKIYAINRLKNHDYQKEKLKGLVHYERKITNRQMTVK